MTGHRLGHSQDSQVMMHLLPDEGSQLIEGCQDIRLNFKDIQGRLFCNVQVQFDITSTCQFYNGRQSLHRYQI